MNSFLRTVWCILGVLTITSCNDLIEDLGRNNPLDKKNDEFLKNGVALHIESITIEQDDNQDKIINKGEEVYVSIELKNFGEKSAKNVTAEVKSESLFIESIEPSILNFGDIKSEKKVTSVYSSTPTNSRNFSFKLNVSENLTEEAELSFKLLIKTENGDLWSYPFLLPSGKISANLVFDRYVIVQDNNQDEKANFNETIYLQVYAKNKGTSSALNVQGKITSMDTNVTEIIPSNEYLLFNSGSTSNSSIEPNRSFYALFQTLSGSRRYSLRFKVNKNLQQDTVLKFKIEMKDALNNNWTDYFEIPVKKTDAKPEISRVELQNDNDNKISPGEKVFLRVYIRNIGSSNLNKIGASFSTTNPLVNIIQPINFLIFNNGNNSSSNQLLKPGNEYYGYTGALTGGYYYTMEVDIDSNAVVGSTINIIATIEDAESNKWEDSFELRIE